MNPLLVRMFQSILPASVKRKGYSFFHQVATGTYEAQFKTLSMKWSLQNLAAKGFRPATVIDVGAFVGNWTRMALDVFPEARFIMVEAQPEKRTMLQSLTDEHPGKIVLENVLLGPESRKGVPFFAMQAGSSVLEEMTDYARSEIRLDMTTLDELSDRHKCEGPLLIKLDTQGYEVEILKGADRTLESTEFALMEISVLNYNKGAPLLAEVVAFMKNRGFVLYDLCDLTRRSEDDVLFQFDALFSREQGDIRARSNLFRDAGREMS